MKSSNETNLMTAIFGGGCFWCMEAVFKRLVGVTSVTSGYAGIGQKPSYESVSTGTTGFVEAVKIIFDPTIITYSQLLDVFWATHDPTTRNRQGNDVGTQYQSVIYYINEEQKHEALRSIEKENTKETYKNPIVTQVIPFTEFYDAEEYHQNYYDNMPSNPYCSLVISPKIEKLLNSFGSMIKEEYQ